MIWLNFALLAFLVVAAGILIGPLVSALGDRLRLGQAWAGTVLLSFATTLPELVTTASLASRGSVGIALGNVLGSCIFNLFILIVVDAMSPKPLYMRLSNNHMVMGVLGCALLALSIIGMSLGASEVFGRKAPRIGSIGITTIAIFIIYGISQVAVLRLSKRSFVVPESASELTFWDNRPLPFLFLAFASIGATIVLAAYHLGVTVETISERYSLGATFAGATLLGVVTSLPEVTNSIASTKRGHIDLVLGNVLGANAFLILVIGIADIFFLGGALFYSVGRTEAESAVILAATAVVMQTIVLGGIAIRSDDRVWRISLVSIILVSLYAFSLFVAYRFSSG
jgi:cation:H+ antiporter